MSKIQDKVNQLNKAGFDLGAAIDKSDQSAGSGGQYRRFKNATIYWHPVMGDEAHEVHGGILDMYLELGGPGKNPKTGRRELGFPLSDETRTRVREVPISYFEWGAIIWKDGGIVLSGDFYTTWKDAGAEAGPWGYPLTEVVGAAGGQAVFFEYGCLWKGSYSKGKVEKIYFGFPKIGNPAFIPTNNPSGLNQEVYVQLLLGLIPPPKLEFPASFFNELLGGRLFLVPTGQPKANPIALTFPEKATKVVHSLLQTYFRGQSTVNFAEISENTLYDVSLKLPSGKMVSLAPHAVYFKNSWKDFGAMHVTDIHVSQRLDKFRAKLKKLGKEEGAKAFNNYNDNFRDLIRYANKLHDDGKLDLIIATGDLLEYEFEENPNNFSRNLNDEIERMTTPSLGAGNYAFFEKLLRGQVPSPEGTPSEELRVPILTTLGNHDYRAYQFMLNFDIGILGVDDPTVRNYAPMNLTNEEANDLQGGFKTVSQAAAKDMAKIDGKLEYYLRRFSDSGSFVVRLGKHQILMLDTRWDKDMVNTDWEAFKQWLNAGTESENNFAAGHPNSEGLEDSQINLLRKTLNEPQGLVLIGMHAPPVNPKGNEYPHYFRETEHRYLKIDFKFPYLKDEISAYVFRQDLSWLHSHNGWFEAEGESYFYKGKDGEDLLDYGISKGKIREFLQLCAGDGVARKADLVLCGHIHKRAEFRLAWNEAKDELHFYFDFYTENPSQYYPSKKLGFDKPVHIEVKEGVPVPAPTKPATINKKSAWGDYQVLQVPPYANPLNKAANKSQWWKTHSPLILQTAAVGPIEANQRLQTIIGEKRHHPGPSFQGCRVITIKNDIIESIEYVHLAKFK